MSEQLKNSSHSKIKRAAQRASYDLQKVLDLVSEIKMGHLGFISNNRPVIIPMTLWVYKAQIYFHVANKSRLQKLLLSGQEICVSVATTDEWVLSKSAYHHSANYRSAVLYCTGEQVNCPDEFNDSFKSIINELEADRYDKVRAPNAQEIKATALMKLQINEGAYKTRTGGPNEFKQDMDLPVHNGVIKACPFHKV